jgi:hypothetical protein
MWGFSLLYEFMVGIFIFQTILSLNWDSTYYCSQQNISVINLIFNYGSYWKVLFFKIVFHYSNLNGILLLVLSVVVIMNRMTLLRDIAVFVVRQKIHHFTPGWYHILVGRHVERPCSHAVGTAACFCVIQVSTVNLNCFHGSPRTKMACCCQDKTPPLPATILQNLWQYRYTVKCYNQVQYSAILFFFYKLDVCCSWI